MLLSPSRPEIISFKLNLARSRVEFSRVIFTIVIWFGTIFSKHERGMKKTLCKKKFNRCDSRKLQLNSNNRNVIVRRSSKFPFILFILNWSQIRSATWKTRSQNTELVDFSQLSSAAINGVFIIKQQSMNGSIYLRCISLKNLFKNTCQMILSFVLLNLLSIFNKLSPPNHEDEILICLFRLFVLDL